MDKPCGWPRSEWKRCFRITGRFAGHMLLADKSREHYRLHPCPTRSEGRSIREDFWISSPSSSCGCARKIQRNGSRKPDKRSWQLGWVCTWIHEGSGTVRGIWKHERSDDRYRKPRPFPKSTLASAESLRFFTPLSLSQFLLLFQDHGQVGGDCLAHRRTCTRDISRVCLLLLKL